MQKKFDAKKLTLTNFNPADFQKATSKLNVPTSASKLTATGQGKEESAAAGPSSVPAGRTTLRLNKVRGVIGNQEMVDRAASAVSPTPPPDVSSEQPEPKSTKSSTKTQNVLKDVQQQGETKVEENISADNHNDGINLEEARSNDDASDKTSDNPPADTNLSIRTAALSVQTSKKSGPKAGDSEALVQFAMRQPRFLKDMFFKKCRDNNMTPTLVVRNMMKSFCGLCLLFVFTVHAGTADKAFTSDDIFNYFFSKNFGIQSLVPGFKTGVSVRHSLWQTGGQDSTDYVYADHSNTRLEARIDIPILDISYLRDRSKDKVELRAFVFKSLSKILAAQKSVNVLSERSGALGARIQYTKNQVTIKLANKSDLFPLEDQFYTVQTQLFESQSTLDQRIIELASIAGSDWQDAYKMITKWDGKLFD